MRDKLPERLSLAAALESGRLADFVLQAEAEGIGPADRSQFDALMKNVTGPTKPAKSPSRHESSL